MSTKTYRPEVREQAGQILWAEADLLDRVANTIHDEYMTSPAACAYIRDLAARYRQAASDATRGRDEVTQ